jgi:hypothetical protein
MSESALLSAYAVHMLCICCAKPRFFNANMFPFAT